MVKNHAPLKRTKAPLDGTTAVVVITKLLPVAGFNTIGLVEFENILGQPPTPLEAPILITEGSIPEYPSVKRIVI
jgi:hypothetical protein